MDLCKNYLLAYFHDADDLSETVASDFYFNIWLKLENSISNFISDHSGYTPNIKITKKYNFPPLPEVLAEFFTWFESKTKKANAEFFKFQQLQVKAREKEKKELLKKYKNYEEIPGKLKWKFIPFFSAQNYDNFRFFVTDFIEFMKLEKNPESFQNELAKPKEYLSEVEIFRKKRTEKENEKIEQEIIRNLILEMTNCMNSFMEIQLDAYFVPTSNVSNSPDFASFSKSSKQEFGPVKSLLKRKKEFGLGGHRASQEHVKGSTSFPPKSEFNKSLALPPEVQKKLERCLNKTSPKPEEK